MTGSTEPYTDGSIITAAGQNSAHWRVYTEQGLNHIRQLIDRSGVYSAGQIGGWGEAYVDTNGRNNSVDTTTTGNTTTLFNANKYQYQDWNLEIYLGTSIWIIIEADSISSTTNFEINDCKIKELESGKWALYCTIGTDEVRRAQIYKTLFYGTNGSDARASSTYITSITALKTSISRDIGKQAYLQEVTINAGPDTGTTGTYNMDITFNDTSNNNYCSSWSRIHVAKIGFVGTVNNYIWELPDGTALHTFNGGSGGSATSDELGTDLKSDETNNPTDAQFVIPWDNSGSNRVGGTMSSIILCYGTLSVGYSGNTPPSYTTNNINFNSDNSIPILSDGTSTIVPGESGTVYHDIPTGKFPSNISSAIGVPMIADWETGADIQYKLTNATEDTGWLDTMDTSPEVSSFTAFTSEPTTLIVKLIPKTTSPTAGYPSVKGFYINSWSD